MRNELYSTGVAVIGAEVATIDPIAWPALLGRNDRTPTVGVVTEVDLIGELRHEGATSSCVMNFMVPVRLLVGVDDETWHLKNLLHVEPLRLLQDMSAVSHLMRLTLSAPNA